MKKLCVISMLVSLSLASASYADLANGQKIYDAKCTKCHGSSGGGDGKSAKKLDTEPTRFDDGKLWHEKKGLNMSPEARIRKSIKEGGESVKQSKEMDAFPDLTSAELDDLIEVLKSFSNENK